MEIKVIGNALDFIARGAKDFWDEQLSEEQQVKYSTIHLYEGIELVLKARLMKEHWSLAVSDLDQYKRESFEKGDFISVNYETARKRLDTICKVKIDDEANQAFNQLRQFRNRYVHFTCDEPRASVLGVQLQAWHHALRMLEFGFLGNLNSDQLAQIGIIKKEMLQSEDFLNTRFKLAKPKIKEARDAGHLVAKCPTCGRKSLIIGDGEISCPVCGKSDMYPTDAAEGYAAEKVPWWDIKDGAEPTRVGWCEYCGDEAVVLADKDLRKQAVKRLSTTPGKAEEVHVCFSCGEVMVGRWFKECGWCGAHFFRSDDESGAVTCPACERFT